MTSPSSHRDAVEALAAAARKHNRDVYLVEPEHAYYRHEKRIQGVSEVIEYLVRRGDWCTPEDAERGTAVHDAIAEGVPSELMGSHRGYLHAWDGWCTKAGYTPVDAELIVTGAMDLFAGKPDNLGYNEAAGVLVSIKTHRTTIPKRPEHWWSLQEAAYKWGLVNAALASGDKKLLEAALGLRVMVACLGPNGEHSDPQDPRWTLLQWDPQKWEGDNAWTLWPELVTWVRRCRGRRYGGKL